MSKSKTLDPAELNDRGMKQAMKLGVDDAVFISVVVREQMVRFANNSLSVTKNIEEKVFSVYLAQDGRRIVGASSNADERGLERFVERLQKTLLNLSKEPDYAPLPREQRSFKTPGPHDGAISDVEDQIPKYVEQAIQAAEAAGAKRSAGAIEANTASTHILTSSGTTGSDTLTNILLNIRSFTDRNASGHGLSCSSTLKGFKPAEAGRRAGEHSKRMLNSKKPEEGTYEVLMSPTVASNLISLVGSFASAFAVDAGTSYLADKVGKKVASDSFNLTDHGRIDGGLGGRTFDDEGTPTGTTKIVEGGILKQYLHNVTTAKKFKTKSTGNAGWIEPNPWNLEVGAGDSTYAEMVREMKHGIILTSNWYTRFTNYRTGEFSTVPRDGAYLVEKGVVSTPVAGLRISDSLERLLSSVKLMSKAREWIQWWEVDEPTLCPWILVDGVKITKAYGS